MALGGSGLEGLTSSAVQALIDAAVDTAVSVALDAHGDFQYDADNLLLPAGADWLFTTPAGGPVADTNNGALRVLLLDDTVTEGFGWQHVIPDGATSFTIDLIHRAETAPAGTRQVGTQLAVRQVPDNAIVQTPFAQINTGDLDLPANEFFQYDQFAFTLAFFGLTAGELTQWQIGRDSAAGTNLTGDWAVAEIRMMYS
jgi:hypothetical protein